MEKLEKQEETKTEAKRNKSWKWIIVGIISVILLTSMYLFFALKNDPLDGESLKKLEKFSLSSFTVNLSDRRYLRTSITVEYTSKELGKELEFSQHRVKDAVLEVLRNKRVSEIDTSEETELLREELLEAINSRLKTGEATGLYFEEFIIQ